LSGSTGLSPQTATSAAPDVFLEKLDRLKLLTDHLSRLRPSMPRMESAPIWIFG